MFSRFAHICTAFRNNATTVVLLSTELIMATGNISRTNAFLYVLGLPRQYFTIHCSTPEYTNPAMMTNSVPVMTTDSEPKLLSASLMGSTPVTAKTTMLPMNT